MKVLPIESLTSETRKLMDVVNDEPDFPCVLIVTSFLDQCTGALLERFFVQGTSSERLLQGPLHRFPARSRLCYSLGLIPEGLLSNLLTISEIRNRFAHSYLSMTFEDEVVARLCSSLTFPHVHEYVGVDGTTGEPLAETDPWARFQHPRTRFTIVATMAASRLQLYALGAERRVAQLKGWEN